MGTSYTNSGVMMLCMDRNSDTLFRYKVSANSVVLLGRTLINQCAVLVGGEKMLTLSQIQDEVCISLVFTDNFQFL